MTLTDFFTNTYVQTTILSILSAIVAAVFATRPRVIWSETHQSSFRLKPNEENAPVHVRTSEIWIKNTGRAPAKHLEVVLNYRPQHYQIWKPRKCEEKLLDDDRLSLVFETLGPKDEIEISMLDAFVDTPMVVGVRHEAGLAAETKMQTTEKPSALFLYTFLFFSIVGFLFVIYQLLAFLGPMLVSSL